MGKFAIAVHGGAGPDSDHIKKKLEEHERGLEDAVEAGYKVLEKGGSAIDAVEAAVRTLEDNPLFNSGRGSAINSKGEVEMSASIMDGASRNCGAVAMVKNVKNPVSLAKAIMANTRFIGLGGEGALDYAKKIQVELEPESYFITEHQYDVFRKERYDEFKGTTDIAKEQINGRMHGTVGAVAIDKEGNMAAATSTGGTENQKEGRISDSCLLGAGTFANNETCAVSATGDGEYIIRGVLGNTISNYMNMKDASLHEACNKVIFEDNKGIKGDIGVIAVDKNAEICMAFNSERMHRGYRVEGGNTVIGIYKDKQ